MTDGLLPKAEGRGHSVSGHPQHRGDTLFDCCTERYEIVVLLPNSDQYKITAARRWYQCSFTLHVWFSHFKLSITSLFLVRNIKCGPSFSELKWAEHFETEIEQIRRNFLFGNKTASPSATPGIKWCATVHNYFIHYCATVITITPRCCGWPDGTVVRGRRATVHRVIHSTEGVIVFFTQLRTYKG